MKLKKASTGQGELPLRGNLGAPGWLSLTASAKAFLKLSEEGSKLDMRSQYKNLQT